MLQDLARNQFYADSFGRNKAQIKGKIVLDVGCGTGILSMMAAKAGAKHVYAVEMSDIADLAKLIIQENGYGDQITVLKSKIEDLDLQGLQVDIIVSEWMGYCLFYEAMFDSVIFARDKFLKSGGIMIPDRAEFFVAAALHKECQFDDVGGFNLKHIAACNSDEPLIACLNRKDLRSDAFLLKTFDLTKITVEEVQFSQQFDLQLTNSRSSYNSIVTWFTVSSTRLQVTVQLSTAPTSKETHWKQTTFFLHSIPVNVKGYKLKGEFKCSKAYDNPRDLKCSIKMSSIDIDDLGGAVNYDVFVNAVSQVECQNNSIFSLENNDNDGGDDVCDDVEILLQSITPDVHKSLQIKKPSKVQSIVPLKNRGSTCYLNAALQVLQKLNQLVYGKNLFTKDTGLKLYEKLYPQQKGFNYCVKRDSAEAFLNIADNLKLDPSFFSKIELEVTCKACSNVLYTKDTGILNLPIKESIGEAINFLSEELTDLPDYLCSACLSRSCCTQKVKSIAFGNNVLVQYRRFYCQVDALEQLKLSNSIKSDDTIVCPTTNLRYDLVAYVNHIGYQTFDGHYTALIKQSGIWYMCNDDQVYEISNLKERTTYRLEAYYLLYVKNTSIQITCSDKQKSFTPLPLKAQNLQMVKSEQNLVKITNSVV